MIKEEFVTVKWTHHTRAHYEALGYKYTKLFSEFEVAVNHLPSGSGKKITSICDKCNIERSVAYKDYKSKCYRCDYNEYRKNKKINYSLIIDKNVYVKWSGSNKSYYQKLGYQYTGHNSLFLVSITHLSPGSTVTINAMCNMCFKIRGLKFCQFNEFCIECIRPNSFKKAWSNSEFRDKKISFITNLVKKNGTGKNHPSWNMDVPESFRLLKRRGYENDVWKLAVKNKYENKCSICKDSKNIQAHHLMSFHKYPSLRYEVGNGVCLCKNCHIKFHKYYGYKNNEKYQFDEFLNIIHFESFVN